MDHLVFDLIIKGKKALTNFDISVARDGLVTYLASNAINQFGRKTIRKIAVRAGKGFTSFILNQGMNDIIKIIKSLENSNA